MNRFIPALIFCLLSTIIFSQEKFVFNKNGLTEYVVYDAKNKDSKVLYEKTLEWIKNTFKDPNEVIKVSSEGEKIRIEGFDDSLICVSVLSSLQCYLTTYGVEFEFKDGRYRIKPLYINYMAGGIRTEVPLGDDNIFFKKNGKLRNTYKETPSRIEDLFNKMSYDLSNHIFEKNKKEDW